MLTIHMDKNLALFQEVAPEVQSIHSRLEPAQVAESITDWEPFYVENKKWGG